MIEQRMHREGDHTGMSPCLETLRRGEQRLTLALCFPSRSTASTQSKFGPAICGYVAPINRHTRRNACWEDVMPGP
ncbi:hypothetical protein SKAU_G00205280 [Synaphobranchus kaupii]|uniref:Uncharacterized protein n=1 Tax=Synaphobranchus kaupii TaxID=118154 RepID=A0A9Q1FGB5_SYNKA|nr:hypothetical protein SKAU_G00205280 [Synaphobranchus kaupii]